MQLNPTFSGAGTITNAYYEQITGTYTATTASTAAIGLLVGPTLNASGAATGFTLSSAAGESITAAITASETTAGQTTTIANAYGILVNPTLTATSTGGTGAITNAYGELVNPSFVANSTGTAGTITAAYGLRVTPTATVTAGGAVTTQYGLYVDIPTGATTNYTAILGQASGTVVGIATNTPSTSNVVTIDGTYATTSAQTTSLAITSVYNQTNSPGTVYGENITATFSPPSGTFGTAVALQINPRSAAQGRLPMPTSSRSQVRTQRRRHRLRPMDCSSAPP